MSNYNHFYHLVNISPWPLMSSFSCMILLMGMINMFNYKNINLMILGLLLILIIMYQWWRDVSRESTFQGFHTFQVIIGLKLGMILFIISEILFFISFFWTFFHLSLSSSIELGMTWPSKGINTFDPFKIPLLNTIILLSSGISITWTHNSILNKNHLQSFYSLLLTIILGIYFLMIQMFEYMEAPFNIANSSYGSIFFMMTGFHGIHVMIGTLFLIICLLRHNFNHFSSYHHFGFEAAAWYWHFVDIIWLLLFLCIYWWSK